MQGLPISPHQEIPQSSPVQEPSNPAKPITSTPRRRPKPRYGPKHEHRFDEDGPEAQLCRRLSHGNCTAAGEDPVDVFARSSEHVHRVVGGFGAADDGDVLDAGVVDE